MAKKILIVDDSQFMRAVIKDILEKQGYEIAGEAATGEAAIDMAMDLNPDVVTLDNILPDMQGTDILKVYKQEGLSCRVILISAVGQDSAIEQGMSMGAHAYIVKPFTPEQLAHAIEK
ncbi:response regulator [Rhodocytophaga aerolata]|uniref:Response regulator n=1 Tax=Rhodocytophaga aerolata TaxID=455078 RepID=A0ABT8R5Z3_9BACT|nr:response regulator [Rhodocytophaga aerolata]MDO1446693.1 response regulator [Rhodocytophaga aerolata]